MHPNGNRNMKIRLFRFVLSILLSGLFLLSGELLFGFQIRARVRSTLALIQVRYFEFQANLQSAEVRDGRVVRRALDKILSAVLVHKRVSTGEMTTALNGPYEFLDQRTQMVAVSTEQCFLDEQDYQVIEKSLINPWRSAWSSMRVKDFMGLANADLRFSKLVIEKQDPSKLGIVRLALTAPARGNLNGQQEIEQAITSYLASFQKIQDMTLETVKVSVNRSKRNPSDYSYDEATLLAHFDIRGIAEDGVLQNDRGVFSAEVSKVGGFWKLRTLHLENGERLRNKNPGFVEITARSGVDKVPVYLRNEAIRRGGYAIATGDFNRDGNTDIYEGAAGAGTLLQGDGSGNFRPVHDSGLEQETAVKTAIFADFDNDGWSDLLLIRFIPSERRDDIVVYHNVDGKFKLLSRQIKNRLFADRAMPATVADFDGDGYLDFYVGFPGAKDFTVLEQVINDPAKRIVAQGLFLNQKGHGFVDATEKSDLNPQGIGAARKLFPHSSMAIDYDQDGKMDIVVMDDRVGLSPVYHNQGNAQFSQVAESIGMSNYGYGMGVAAGDYNGDGLIDFAMSNVEFTAHQRLLESCSANLEKNLGARYLNGVRLFKNQGQGKFSEIPVSESGISWPGEGTAGLEFLDYNNDGLLDLYVANGLWSGTSREQDLSSLFSRARYKGYWFGQVNAADPISRSDFMEVLSRGKGLLRDIGGNVSDRPSMAGFQRNRLYRNDGNGHFTEVGFLEGVDSIADGYAVTLSDINKDGRVDLILRNGDPGTEEYKFPALQLYLNQTLSQNSLRVQLEGAKANREAIGSSVTLFVAGKKQYRQLIENNGPSQSERVLHFGLGRNKRAERVEVRWPSGAFQVLRNVPAGSLSLKEPELAPSNKGRWMSKNAGSNSTNL